MPRAKSTALPIAYVVLRTLIVLNWAYGAVLIGIVVASLSNQQWTLRALGVPVADQTAGLANGIRTIALLGVITVPLHLAMLKRMVDMVHTVRAGDPFVVANAYRLQAIGWVLLALQFIGLAVWAVGKLVSTPAHPLHLDAGFSPGGMARRHHDVRPGACVRRGCADARRPRRDGVTWRLPSSLTTFCTNDG